jgi:tripartite-type tricarboxylate transporter receptor subunit TctC
VPTLTEAGFPGIGSLNWNGIFVPAKTPKAIVAKLNSATLEAMRSPEVIEKLASQGAILSGGTPEQFSVFLKSEIARWSKVVKQAGIKVE